MLWGTLFIVTPATEERLMTFEATIATPQSPKQLRSRDSFYLSASGLILLLVLAGFAPTLYLRPMFEVRPIPPYLYVHGILLTSWFVLFFIQALLVSSGRTHIHKQLGIAATAIGAVIPFASLMAILGIAGRRVAVGVDLDRAIEGLTRIVVSGLLVNLVFASMLLAGVLLRRRTDYHKRLMLWGTLFLIDPATSRIGRWSVFEGITVQFWAMIIIMVILAAHDLFNLRKLHRVTIIGIMTWCLINLLMTQIPTWGLAQAFVRATV